VPDSLKSPFPDREDAPYAEDGVDVTLIRWMLSLTPAERLQALQQFARSILRMRAYASRA